MGEAKGWKMYPTPIHPSWTIITSDIEGYRLGYETARKTDRDTDRDTERDRQRDRERQTETEGQRERQTERQYYYIDIDYCIVGFRACKKYTSLYLCNVTLKPHRVAVAQDNVDDNG